MTRQEVKKREIRAEYLRDSREDLISALKSAFECVDVDLMERSPLYDQVELEAVETVVGESQTHTSVAANLYSFQVRITEEKIRIFNEDTTIERD
jgi:hypothetical protein